MTDEELGRKWCERNGKRPLPTHLSGGYKPPSWDDDVYRNRANSLSAELLEATRGAGLHFSETPGGCGSLLSFETGEEAYTALGAALRRVTAMADEVRAICGEAGA